MLGDLMRCGHGAERSKKLVIYPELNRAALPEEEESLGKNLGADTGVGDDVLLKS